MTPIADMVEQMLEAGAPATAIVLAVRAMEKSSARQSSDQSSDARQRRLAYDREYQFNRRKQLKKSKEALEANDASTSNPSSDASSDSADERCNLSSFLSSSVEVVQESKKEVGARARGTRMTPDWYPDAELREFACAHNVDPDELRPEFVDYWIAIPGQRGMKTNWPATWRNRVRKIQSYKKEKSDGQRGNILPAFDRLKAKLAAFGRGDEPDLLSDVRGGASAPHVRLLPKG